jgi:hypothetical protein
MTGTTALTSKEKITQFSFLLERPHPRKQERDFHANAESLRANLSPIQPKPQTIVPKARPVSARRDAHALAALDSRRTRLVLRKTLKGRDYGLAAAVRVHAPNRLSEQHQTKRLVAALSGSDSAVGLRQALLQVEQFHPPQVVDALFRGVLFRYGVAAVYLAAMLMFVRGKADSPFDSRQLPFLLKFNTEVRAEREAVFLELCEKLGVDGTRYLAPAKGKS